MDWTDRSSVSGIPIFSCFLRAILNIFFSLCWKERAARPVMILYTSQECCGIHFIERRVILEF